MTIDISKLITAEMKLAEATRLYEQGITNAIQLLLDTKAQELEYDNIHTACGWAGSIPSATALKDWGASCWAKSTEIRNLVKSGARPLPTIEEVLTELPLFVG